MIKLKIRGFVFTIDSMFALSALSLLALVYMVISYSHFEMQRYSDMERIGEDYLRLNYRENIPVDSAYTFIHTNRTIYGVIGTQLYPFDGDMGPFKPLNGTWTNMIGDSTETFNYTGYLSQTYYAPGAKNIFHAIAPALDSANYVIEVKMKYGAYGPSQSDPIGGISIRSNLDGTRYTCLIFSNIVDSSWGCLGLEPIYGWGAHFSGQCSSVLGIRFPNKPNYWITLGLNATKNTIHCYAQDSESGQKAEVIVLVSKEFSAGFPVLEGNSASGQNTETSFDNFTITAQMPNSTTLMKGLIYDYPAPCGCMRMGCVIANNSPCLKIQENINVSKKQVWIS